MTPSTRAWAAALWSGAVLVGSPPVRAQISDTTGLKVTPTFTAVDGRPVQSAEPGQPLRVQLGFADALTAQPVSGLSPVAWLRRLAPGKAPCTEAARAFRATGRVSQDDVALTGTLLLAMDDKGRVSTIEPEMSLATSNIATIVPLSEPARQLLAHRDGLAFAALSTRGEIVRFDPLTGRQAVFASGFKSLSHLLDAPQGRVWASSGTDLVLFDADGRKVAQHKSTSDILDVIAAGDDRVVVITQSSAAVYDRSSGAKVVDIAGAYAAETTAASSNFILSATAGRSLQLAYLDEPARLIPIETSGLVSGVVLGHGGRLALAWSDEADTIDIIDVGLSRRVHAFKASDKVDRALIVGDAAFVTYRTRGVVTVINLLMLKSGDSAQRDVRLIEQAQSHQTAAGTRPRTHLLSLAPASAVLAGRIGSKTMFTVMDGGGLTTSPMSTLQIRSDAPVRVARHIKALRETSTGIFETSTVLHRPGAWELVSTTGVRGTTACFHLTVTGAAPQTVDEGPRIEIADGGPVRAGEAVQLRLRVLGLAPGRRLPERAEFLAMAINSGWRERLVAQRGADGAYTVTVKFPWHGQFPILTGDRSIQPALVEVTK